MEYSVTLVVLSLIGWSQALQVNLSSNWVSDLGWQVVCSWRFQLNDSLQSVRWYDNNRQFMIYRPEIFGSNKRQSFTTDNDVRRVDCEQTMDNSDTGHCVLTIEPYTAVETDGTYGCEVSGERPWFLIMRKDYKLESFVQPSNAIVVMSKPRESPSRATFNCSSTGLPAPNLVWTVGDQKVTPDFTGRMWNSRTKLWHVWSYLSATATDLPVQVLCTPEAKNVKGQPAGYALVNQALNVAASAVLYSSLAATLLLR